MGFLTSLTCTIIIFDTSLIFFIIGIGGPFLFEHLRKEGIKKKLLINKENEESWSATPGKTGV